MHAEPSPPFSLRFTVGRIPVVVEPTFWLLIVFFQLHLPFEYILAWVAVCFVSFLVHELGHALMAMSFGSEVAVRLYSFGGLCYHRTPGRWRNVAVSLAGPLAGFLFYALLVGVQWVVPPRSYLASFAFHSFEFVNLYWGLVNLLPVPPLDGGHVSLGVLGPSRQRLGLLLGVVTAALAALFFLSQRWLFIGVMFALMGVRCFQVWREARDFKPQPPAPPEPDALSRGWAALRAGDEHEAARLAHLALSAARPGAEANGARDLLAWVALAEGDARAALSHLERVSPPEAAPPFSLAMVYDALGMPERALPAALAALEKEPLEAAAALALRLLLAQRRLEEAERIARHFPWRLPATRDARLADVAEARGEHGVAAGLYAAAFEAAGRGEDAFKAARGHARDGQVERAADWLQRALQAGFDDFEALAQEPALAPVRAQPGIAARLAGR